MNVGKKRASQTERLPSSWDGQMRLLTRKFAVGKFSNRSARDVTKRFILMTMGSPFIKITVKDVSRN